MALFPPPAGARFARQSVRRGWLGGVGGIALTSRQLPLQLLDLLLLLVDLIGLLGKLLVEPFHLALQTLNLAVQRLRLRR